MQGRYGIDHIYVTSLILYFVGLIVLRQINNSIYLNIFLLLLIAWTFYRVFSKNIARRYAENQAFLRFINQIKSIVNRLWMRMRDIGTHRYRRCPNCRAQLRLPRKIGVHTARCPRCNNRFKVKIRL